MTSETVEIGMNPETPVTAETGAIAKNAVTPASEAEHDPLVDSSLDSLSAYSKLAGLIGSFLDDH